ncbi:dTDP-4-amino-4,6-dideoxy-D-galactose acyltransferase [Serratia ficaria]|uniref:dTDP-4-amino-4,6-dideoxy-D-galactose acyltransferase n=1 Tax=Serratia ficaria TaxID=61651 RepID=UPI0021798E6B|nr:dTDP-4-amino-4,6-dideoxy-D-galactose acyltransferase [Serratia ficaria]CAI1096684.1 TDP-fucosamine acetyltransferase [Serratia ficaria]CAI1907713.1 TDP-fucosamine acetyltransferase [Serratia ficaria]
MHLHASVEPLAWESEFFRLNSAKLDINASASALTVAELDAFSLVQAKIPAQRLDLIDALAGVGFQLAEGEIDLKLPVGMESALSDDAPLTAIRPAIQADIPALRAAAGKVFTASRFRSPWYRIEDSGRFYALWIEKAVLGTFDHQCLLALDEHGRPAGFVSLRDTGDREARIGLLAAFPGAEGKGIGSRLMNAAIAWCAQRQLRHLRVATQTGNIAALRLYQRHGAAIESTAYWLYRGRHDSI